MKNEFDLADSENKGRKEDSIFDCPLPIPCMDGFPKCQSCLNAAWIELISQHPTPIFDFDRPHGHAQARLAAVEGK